jgi:hypothetical protein
MTKKTPDDASMTAVAKMFVVGRINFPAMTEVHSISR